MIAQHPGIAKNLYQEAMRIYSSASEPAPAPDAYDDQDRLEVERRLRDLGTVKFGANALERP
ncbi:MAG: hypothetical protein L0Y67_00710 [Gammaproteobacteria bacterium]|nr:hypothetical protein [Gammaproteobacteria bacterium]